MTAAIKALASLDSGMNTPRERSPERGHLAPCVTFPTHAEGAEKGFLELSNGDKYEGYSFGYDASVSGECVFTTGLTGYTESLTDPSYAGQILVLTFPLVGSYGVSDLSELTKDLPEHFESYKVHVAGLIILNYSGETGDYSHHLAQSSLGDWLKKEKVPALYGIDTRDLTKFLREQGSTLGKIVLHNADVPFVNPNAENLVQRVSRKAPHTFLPADPARAVTVNGRTLRILALDLGIKNNQIRCFINRGVEVKVVPYDYDFLSEDAIDGLFLSNGPGDPAVMTDVVARIKAAVAANRYPIFGICLGHQLLARATGAETVKLKYGNRGANIPCTSLVSGRCYITSQNHGFAVDVATLPANWGELFVNANDGSNEGVYALDRPDFSVQFHPEAAPGPEDTEFLFDTFISTVKECATDKSALTRPVAFPGGLAADNARLHPRVDVKKVLVLGSGGLSIGQAGEFDYSGSQAIKALKEEGIYTVLINPNIATIQTSAGLADKVYFLPVNAEFVRKVIERERPDGIYVTFGGQTALSVGIQLKDEFAALGVRVLGTPIDTIITTEDRDLFARAIEEIDEKCAQSASAENIADSVAAANAIGYPVIVRAAFALGGLGSGFANNEGELVALCTKAFATSPQVLIEKSMKGWKEIEYEVVRDAFDNVITVCNMENFDPLGIHTGDSIVVAPSQTLSNADFNMLRTTAINVIRHLGVVGECNIQYALNPHSREYCIIEVNARLSRSSALASKATGYPLAFVAAKLGLNLPLPTLRNAVTRTTSACFEPSLDYVVVKFPRWDLKKFNRVSTLLSSSMKSVGEVMAVGKTFEETIQKAIRAVDPGLTGFGVNGFADDITRELENPTDQRMFAIAAAFREGRSVEDVHALTRIDRWFLRKLYRIFALEKRLATLSEKALPPDVLLNAKQMGFSDAQIAAAVGSNELAVRRTRLEYGFVPRVKQIDTVAAEFPCVTNYLYMTYNGGNHDIAFDDQGIMVLGSGVYRIGSSVEFDWCAVRAIRTIRERGFKTIMVNYNPETVSTDYDEADRLYFEVISLETVLDIYQAEASAGIVLSMGGQTSNNIALSLHRQGVKVLGTSPEMIDMAENRYKFSRMLDKLGVDQPQWKELSTLEAAYDFCAKVSFPVLVRPSYVLSGAAMNVVYSRDDLDAYLTQAANVSREHPVVISKYIEEAKEIEMDAVACDGKMVMHYISEHVENAGVHSGDATLIWPPQDLDPETVRRIEDATQKIGAALNVSGPFNIQFIAKNNEIKVIECNVRAARSFPFVSKVSGVDAIELATDVILGLPVEAYPEFTCPASDYVAIKTPQFSFSRLAGADPILGVEMASTGEVACFGKDKYEAYLKALISTGMPMPKKNILFSIGPFKEKVELLPAVRRLHEMGYNLFATSGTADFFQENGIPVKFLESLGESDEKSEYSLHRHLANNLIDLYVNLPSKNKYRRPSNYMSKGYLTRRMAIDFAVPLVTNVKCAKLLVEALFRHGNKLFVHNVDVKSSYKTVTLPGLADIVSFFPVSRDGDIDITRQTQAALAGGFTTLQAVYFDADGSVHDRKSLERASDNMKRLSKADYVLSATGDASNTAELPALLSSKTAVKSLILHSKMLADDSKLSAISAFLAAWPLNRPIITDAQTTDLASILLLISLYSRAIHITNVQTEEDLILIALSKEKGLSVTCDVSVFSLFFSDMKCLPTKAQQVALWKRLDTIDAFSIGDVPFKMAAERGVPYDAAETYQQAVHLLLDAVHQKRLALSDVTSRLSDNVREILDIPAAPDADTYVEVELGRGKAPYDSSITRVVVDGKTVVLDGQLVNHNYAQLFGKDLSEQSRAVKKRARFSSTSGPRPVLSAEMDGHMPSFAQALSPRIDSVDSGNLLQPNLMSLSAGSAPVSALSAPFSPTNALSRRASPLTPLMDLLNATDAQRFGHRHILSVRSFKREDLHVLFGVASEMRMLVERRIPIELLKGRILCTCFYESSTRTSSSFEAAMNRLGGTTVATKADTSSVTKGESLADTVRTLGCYGDVIALRHPDAGSAQEAAKFSPVPIINAGDGIGEHPTQAFLDIYTIREELGTVNGLTITMVGDLKNGRTVHSLVRLLSQYSVTLNFVSPESLRMPKAVKYEATKAGIAVTETTSLASVIERSDVLYVTRVQQERFASAEEYESVKDAYVINNSVLSKAKAHCIVMHPLPRNAELDPEVDFDQRRAAYFRQMRYGLFIRMALLALIVKDVYVS